MAKVTFNSSMNGVSGRMDNWVYRRVNDHTVIARRPAASKRKATAAQKSHRERFRLAGEYVMRVLSDPCQRRAYEALAAKQNRRADKLVMSDFLTPPTIDLIELTSYRRRPGDVIRVLAADDVAVVSVHVTIETSSGDPIEEGAAREVHGVWIYTATVMTSVHQALRITASATDRPGNVGSATVAA
jgi:hypothetical protein